MAGLGSGRRGRPASPSEHLATYGIPSRLLTKDDVAAVKDAGYQGDIDYREKFVELWTTGSTTKDVTVQSRSPDVR